MSSPRRQPCAGSLRSIAAVAAAVVVLASCGGLDGGNGAAADGSASAPAAGNEERSVELADVLRAHGLTSAASAVEVIGLDALTDAIDYTFFVPSDDAFLELGADEIADLFADDEQLITMLRNHVAPGRSTVQNLVQTGIVTTASGTEWDVGGQIQQATVGGARVVEGDIPVGPGGLVHIVDRLLGP